MIVVMIVVSKCSQKEQVSVIRITATEKGTASDAVTEKKDEEDHHAKVVKHFEDKEATVLSSAIREQILFDEKSSMIGWERKVFWSTTARRICNSSSRLSRHISNRA